MKKSSASLIASLTEEEKKKMGRPIVGKKPRDKKLNIRIDDDTLEKLEQLSNQSGKSRGQVIIDLIHEAK